MKVNLKRVDEISTEEYQSASDQYVFGNLQLDGNTIKLNKGAVLVLSNKDEITIYTKPISKSDLNSFEYSGCDCTNTFDFPFIVQALLLQIYSHRKEYRDLDEKDLFHVTAMSIIEEIAELRDSFGLKPWKNKVASKEELLEEFADLMHFFLQLAIVLNIKPEELLEAYIKKVYKNVIRQLAVPEYSIDEKDLSPEFVGHLVLLLEVLNGKITPKEVSNEA